VVQVIISKKVGKTTLACVLALPATRSEMGEEEMKAIEAAAPDAGRRGRTMKGRIVLTLALVMVVGGGSSFGQPAASDACPIYRSPAIDRHVAQAQAIAARSPAVPPALISNLFIVSRLAGLCAPPDVAAPANGPSVALAPTRAFDQLYYVGTSIVGAWALKTDAGIILFDAMNNEAEARDVIEPGLRMLGLDPAEIRIIVLTHGHGDHWGGARYLQDKYGARVLLGRGDGGLLALRNEGRWGDPPRIDGEVRDGITVKLGRARVRLYIMPGHTPGSITALIPVTDNGRPHLVALSGGTGLAPQYEADRGVPSHHAGMKGYIASTERLIALGKRAGIDGAISTHPFFDGTRDKIRDRAANPRAPSPWVMGRQGWLDYEEVILNIAQASAAMAREHPERACVSPKGTAAVVCGRTAG
jgi:metallo-beta-lactamase class B